MLIFLIRLIKRVSIFPYHLRAPKPSFALGREPSWRLNVNPMTTDGRNPDKVLELKILQTLRCVLTLQLNSD